MFKYTFLLVWIATILLSGIFLLGEAWAQCEPDMDPDHDGIRFDIDNCPNDFNPDQTNSDGDWLGDACDPCPYDSDHGGPDRDSDGLGDGCDPCPDDPLNECGADSDGDGVEDIDDNCPSDPNADQANNDVDLWGNACDNCEAEENADQANGDEDSWGNACDNCEFESNEDQADADGDGLGDVCDPCPDDPLNECPPTLISADVLDPTGCETYIGAHPNLPGQYLCGPDDNELCIVEFTFCADGTASKSWEPDPVAGIPGHTDSTAGTWLVDPVTNELQIFTTAPAMGGVIIIETMEVYDTAFTYDGGAKLDLNSARQVPAGDGSSALGNYERHAMITRVITGTFPGTMLDTIDTVMTVADGTWDSQMYMDRQCTGSTACSYFEYTPYESDWGTFPLPGELYQTSAGDYIMQVDDTLVLHRQ